MNPGKQSKRPRCCPLCRLVQPAAAQCVGCGESSPGRLKRRKGAYFSQPELATKARQAARKLLFGLGVALWAALTVLVLHWLGIDRRSSGWLVLLCSAGNAVAMLVVALVIGWLKQLFTSAEQGGRPKALLVPRLVQLPAQLREPRGRTVRGVATAATGQVSAFLQQEPCLAAFLQVGQRHDNHLFLRGVRGRGFVVQPAAGEPVRVTGNTWVVSGDGDADHGATASTRDGTALLGFDGEHLLAGDGPGRTVELTLREGDQVEVSGPETPQAQPTLAAGYRDGGLAQALHGTPQEPVLVRILGGG